MHYSTSRELGKQAARMKHVLLLLNHPKTSDDIGLKAGTAS
jgi:hypothetical protein